MAFRILCNYYIKYLVASPEIQSTLNLKNIAWFIVAVRKIVDSNLPLNATQSLLTFIDAFLDTLLSGWSSQQYLCEEYTTTIIARANREQKTKDKVLKYNNKNILVSGRSGTRSGSSSKS